MKKAGVTVANNERGLTLVEVLAAVAILSIIVIAYATVSGYSMNAFKDSDHRAEAIRFAERVLNEKLTNPGSTPAVPPGYTMTINDTPIPSGVLPAYTEPLPADLNRHVSVQGFTPVADGNGDYNARLLTVTVSWKEP